MSNRRARVHPWLIIVIIAFAIAAPIVFHKQIRFRIWPKNFGEVVPGVLYRAADQHENVYRELCAKHGIRTIVDLSGPDSEEDAMCRDIGVDRFQFQLVGDGTGDPALWAAALEVMADPDRQPVLVHCAAGAQRTTTAVMLYRNQVEGVSFRASYPESFDYRHKPDEWDLLAYLADSSGSIAAIRETGVVQSGDERIPLAEYVRRAHSAGASPEADD